MARHAYSRRYGTKKQSWLDGGIELMRTRLHTLDELHEYYVSLDVAISKIRSGLLLGRSSFLKETRDRNKTEQAMQSLFPMMFQIILVTATPFANVFTEKGKSRVTQLVSRGSMALTEGSADAAHLPRDTSTRRR